MRDLAGVRAPSSGRHESCRLQEQVLEGRASRGLCRNGLSASELSLLGCCQWTLFQPPQTCQKKPAPLSPGSPCSECGIGSGPAFFPVPHKSRLFPYCGFSLTLYIKLVFFFFFLAFCFLNKPKSKTNQVSSIAFFPYSSSGAAQAPALPPGPQPGLGTAEVGGPAGGREPPVFSALCWLRRQDACRGPASPAGGGITQKIA